MDRIISPKTGDYTGSRVTALENAVYLRLTTPQGSYWADPSLGSRLHELKREKDVSRVRMLARQYAEQALNPLLNDGRATALEVSTQEPRSGWLILLITITDAAGNPHPFRHPVKVM